MRQLNAPPHQNWLLKDHPFKPASGMTSTTHSAFQNCSQEIAISSQLALDELKDIESVSASKLDAAAIHYQIARETSLTTEKGVCRSSEKKRSEDYVPVNYICVAARSLIAAWQISNSDDCSNPVKNRNRILQSDAIASDLSAPPRRFQRASRGLIAMRDASIG